MSLVVEFGGNRTIETVPAESVTITGMTILRMIDLPVDKTVKVFTDKVGFITLWSGDEYDAVGQWTDTDVVNRIKQLYP